jgi:hypothetical protein
VIQEYTGKLRYSILYRAGRHQLLVAVPCLIGDLPEELRALFDTGSEWCVLGWGVATQLGFTPQPELSTSLMHTRFGLIAGRLERLPVKFRADEGEPLELEATWFVSEEWPGPTVIGWRGCLEPLRFAVDPREDWFYFAGM